MPKTSITKIERIQNYRQWNTFQTELENIAHKLETPKEKVETKWLYHGSSGVDPKLIYESEEGLDLRFSNKGMWGHGVYLAVDSYVSDRFSNKDESTSERKMFCAQVIIGKSKYLEPDSSLMKPPFMEGSKTDSYDIVQGKLWERDIYISYSNKKVYTQYLITYKKL